MTHPVIKFPCPVRRISIAWRDGEWSVENEVRVESMTLPKSDELPEDRRQHGVTGVWYEAVDANGRALYRQSIEDPFLGMEVFTRDGKMRRAMMEHPQTGMEILVPDVPEVVDVQIYSSTLPSTPERKLRELSNAERIATISLRGRKGDDHGRQ
jgi:hypothetical protein